MVPLVIGSNNKKKSCLYAFHYAQPVYDLRLATLSKSNHWSSVSAVTSQLLTAKSADWTMNVLSFLFFVVFFFPFVAFQDVENVTFQELTHVLSGFT